MKNSKNRPIDFLLRIVAFIIPFYFVFYGPLHDNPEQAKIKILWKYILAGFVAYLFATTIGLFLSFLH